MEAEANARPPVRIPTMVDEAMNFENYEWKIIILFYILNVV